MVLDTSVLVALLSNEIEAPQFESSIAEASVCLISAATLLETSMVVESRFGEVAGRELDLLLLKMKCKIVDVNAEQIEIAREAFRQFGKGRHPAGLNFGDCFSYALSNFTGEPLLFKGSDFSQTDVFQVSFGEGHL